MKRRHFFLALLLPHVAQAHSLKAGPIAIGHAWALPSILNDAQVFMPILNAGETADAIVAARSPLCSTVEFRKNNRYDEVAETEFELLPNKPFAMRPTARHLRLLGLSHALKIGDRFSLILDLRDHGEIAVEVYVEASPGE